MPHVSCYSASELKPSEKQGNFYSIKKIIDKDIDDDKVTWYHVWFDGDLKKDAVWIDKEQLLEDGSDDAIDEYESSVAKTQPKGKKKAMPKKK